MTFRMIRPAAGFINNRSFHSTKVLAEFYERDKKGGYTIKYDKPPIIKKGFFKQSKQTLKILGEQFKMGFEELKEKFTMAPIVLYREGEVDVEYSFNGDPKSLDQWVISCDSDYEEGYSSANLELSAQGTGVFFGNLDTRIPKDGRLTHTGYCNIKTIPRYKSFFRETQFNWSPYTHLIMRIKGDGRTYFINLGMQSEFDIGWYDLYSYLLYTRGGPYWQYVKIPFSKFFMTYKGTIQNTQSPVSKHRVNNIGITLADKITGPFRLEIDYIGVECDNSNTEEFAYEQYKFERPMP